MGRISLELILILIFALFLVKPLVRFLWRRLSASTETRKSESASAEAGASNLRVRRQKAAETTIPRRTAEVRRITAKESAPASTSRHRASRFAPRSLAEVRRGIVLMTILGPCRAMDPPE